MLDHVFIPAAKAKQANGTQSTTFATYPGTLRWVLGIGWTQTYFLHYGLLVSLFQLLLQEFSFISVIYLSAQPFINPAVYLIYRTL